MPSVTSLHFVLFECELNLKDIELFLEKLSKRKRKRYINKRDSNGDTPLLRVLSSSKHPTEVVQLLLHYGADVKRTTRHGFTHLQVALMYGRNVDDISLLLKKGAPQNVYKPRSKSLLCFAFMFFHSEDIIRLLLDTGCVCEYHGSALILHCALNRYIPTLKFLRGRYSFQPKNKLVSLNNRQGRGDHFQLLLERGADVNAIDKFDRSVLCSALSDGIPASHLETLFEAGPVLKCARHASPLLCATSSWNKLEVDVIQLLLDKGALVNAEVLKCALKNSDNDAKTIEFLLDNLKDVDIKSAKDKSNNTLLHLAVRYHKYSVLKCLIKRGIPVDSVNIYGNTALHEAAKHDDMPDIIKILLESGSGVNAQNLAFETPLSLTIKHASYDTDVFKWLIAYGARIGGHVDFGNFEMCYILKDPVDLNTLKCYQMLVKGYLLETCDRRSRDHEHFVWYLIENLDEFFKDQIMEFDSLFRFWSYCVDELEKMGSQIVGEGRTLREFLTGKALFQEGHGIISENDFLNQLLRVIAENRYPMFFDILLAKIGRSSMDKKLRKLQVYEMRDCDQSGTRKKVVLISDVLSHIATFLPDEDLLTFISASYKTADQCCAVESSEAKTKIVEQNN